jgi:abhydrolase domain-containing protein 14
MMPGSLSGKWKAALLIASVCLIILLYEYSGSEEVTTTSKHVLGPREKGGLNELVLPCTSEDSAVIITTSKVTKSSWTGEMFYRHARRKDGGQKHFPAVVLLHGAAFSSKTWLDLNTLKFLGCHGYESFAFDLPGKGESSGLTGVEDSGLIHYLRETFAWPQFVIISPSMSGAYSMPFITSGDTKGLIGFIPIAPVVSRSLKPKMSAVRVGTFHIHGEKDVGLGATAQAMLREIPGATEYVMKGAGHACYMNNPKEFHDVLLKYLKQLTPSAKRKI